MHWTLTCLAGLVLSACDAQAPPDTLVLSSDPELQRLARELLPEVTRRAGIEIERPVRLERRSRDQLIRYLTAKLDEELPVEKARRVTRAYALLGLIPPEMDLRGLLLEVYTEQVAGFYDPDSTALFVIDDQPAEALRTVLAHELVHALQDQVVDLEALTEASRGNDRQVAAHAAIEGHATLVMLEYAMALAGGEVDLALIDGLPALIRPAVEAMQTQFPALGQAPRIVQQSLLFPYLEGSAYVHQLWREQGGRPAPFGEFLPLSTEQVMDPSRVLSVRDDPWEIEVDVSGATVLHTDGLGQMEAALLLEELSGAAAPPAPAAAGWRGDRYALVEGAAGEGLAWVSVWDDRSSRDRYADRLGALLDRLPRPAALERIEVGGVPGLLLRVGDVGRVEPRVRAPQGRAGDPDSTSGTRP